MHIPDGILSAPVWAALDAAAIPAVGIIGRKAQRGIEEARLPLMGVMGAFVFAAQIINFPVGVGTSSHLVGGALLGITLGPAMASIVMTAILVIQALVFQDGGILALGANVLNMAVFGVWAGYLPYRLLKGSKVSVFAGGFLSVFVSAALALAELRFSGAPMPGKVLLGVTGVFALSALIEGAITVAVVNALARMGSKYVRSPQPARLSVAIALAAVLLVTVGVLIASTNPDGIEKLAIDTGIAGNVTSMFATPLADYRFTFVNSVWLGRVGAALLGVLLIYAIATFAARMMPKRQAESRSPATGD